MRQMERIPRHWLFSTLPGTTAEVAGNPAYPVAEGVVDPSIDLDPFAPETRASPP